jgi:carbon storage regulator
MLVLSRKFSESILIGADIRITVVKIDRNQIRLGIEAPAWITVLREELLDGAKELLDVANVKAGEVTAQAAEGDPAAI